MKKMSLLLFCAASFSFVLSGCASYQATQKEVDQSHTLMTEQIKKSQKEILTPRHESALIKHANIAWMASKSVPRESGTSLPPQYEDVTLKFGGRHNIASVAEIIQRATGIKVMIHPDVHVTMKQIAPVSGGSTTQNPAQSPTALSGAMVPSSITAAGTPTVHQGTAKPEGMPGSPGIPGQTTIAQTTGDSDYFMDVPVVYRGPLAGFLDRVTSRLGLDWDYRDGKIEIRRFVTRTFTIIALPGKTDFKSSLGKTGGITVGTASASSTTGSGSTTGTSSAQMEVSANSSIDYWTSLEGAIKAMLSNMGKVAINQGSGTVTITDIRDVIDRIGRFIEEENRILTRQVAFEVKVYSVRSLSDSEFGVDWNLVYQKLAQLSPVWGLSMVSPGSLVGSSAAATGVQILKTVTDDKGTMDRLSGSEAYIKALSTLSKVSLVTSQRAVTLNRQAVPVSITDQTTYLAETTPGTVSAAGGSSSIGLKPGVVTTGFMMNLMPTVTDRNSMVLTITLDMSELRRISAYSVGSGESQQAIQLPEVASTQFIQRVGLRTGETLVITGFERVTNEYDKRTLTKDMSPGFGGSFNGGAKKESIVILVTPVMTEGI